MGEPVNTQVIKERLDAAKGARMKMWLEMCAHCGLCAESCFFYQAHDKDPTYMPSYKVIKTLGELYKKKGEVSREFLEETSGDRMGQVHRLQKVLDVLPIRYRYRHNVCYGSRDSATPREPIRKDSSERWTTTGLRATRWP